jgi:hypothetical protein
MIKNMKTTKLILFALIAFNLTSFAQTVQFPATINLQKSTEFINAITKVGAFPFYIDNSHKMPVLKNKRTIDASYYGINIQNNVPMVCLDDFRYGHKFDNTSGTDGLGILSLAYWLPSNGNYLLLYCIVENDMDYYHEFFVTVTLTGEYIDYLLICDGWRDNIDVNFTQTQVNSDLSLKVKEIRDLSTTYTTITNLVTFPGQKVVTNYTISPSGKFTIGSTTQGTQRTFNISELKGLLINLN